MDDLPILAWLIALPGIFIGGFVSGLAGFGTALFGLGFLLYALPPEPAVAVILALSLVSIAQGLWTVRRSLRMHFTHMLRYLLPAILGVPVGSALLAHVSPTGIKVFIGLVFLAYGTAFSFLRTAPRIETDNLAVDSGVGFIGGVLGGMAGLAGAFATIWSSMKPWSKEMTRAILQPHNFIILLLSALWLARRGVYTAEVLNFTLYCLPALVAGTLTGLFFYRRLDDKAFKTALIRLMFAAGILILLNEARLGF